MSVSDGEQGRACACAVRRHFGLILKTEPFFEKNALRFVRKNQGIFIAWSNKKG